MLRCARTNRALFRARTDVTTPVVATGTRVQHPLRMVMVGCPGSGKGTLSARLEHVFGIHIITAGDLLRWHIKEETELGKEADRVIKAGSLMPDTTMMALVQQKLEQMGEQDFILDGFPRTDGQAKLLTDALAIADRPLSLVVNLQVPEDAILERILDRWTHSPSGRVYNFSFNPPLRKGFDDVTGEPLERRADDNPETFRKRIAGFHQKTAPMIEHFRSLPCPSDPTRPLLVDLAGETSNYIWPKLEALVLERFPHMAQGMKTGLRSWT